ncbi:MAG: hypothetical protein ACI9U2_004051, partial [Bradymonadia bacterium]
MEDLSKAVFLPSPSGNATSALLEIDSHMNSVRKLLVIASVLAFASSAHAQADVVDLQSLMGATLYDQTIFAGTYVTTGASINDDPVFGNILANTYVSTGAGSKVTGGIQTGTAFTTGDGATVGGPTVAVTATSIGANSVLSGSLQSGTDVTLGANSQVVGAVVAGAAAITVGAGATTGPRTFNGPIPVIADESQGVIDAIDTLEAMAGGTALLPGNIAADTTFTAGVYNVAGLLTVAANVIITLDAQGQDSEFIFNISDYLTFGAGARVVVINGTANTRVIWSMGNYASTGALSNIVGVILA